MTRDKAVERLARIINVRAEEDLDASRERADAIMRELGLVVGIGDAAGVAAIERLREAGYYCEPIDTLRELLNERLQQVLRTNMRLGTALDMLAAVLRVLHPSTDLAREIDAFLKGAPEPRHPVYYCLLDGALLEKAMTARAKQLMTCQCIPGDNEHSLERCEMDDAQDAVMRALSDQYVRDAMVGKAAQPLAVHVALDDAHRLLDAYEEIPRMVDGEHGEPVPLSLAQRIEILDSMFGQTAEAASSLAADAGEMQAARAAAEASVNELVDVIARESHAAGIGETMTPAARVRLMRGKIEQADRDAKRLETQRGGLLRELQGLGADWQRLTRQIWICVQERCEHDDAELCLAAIGRAVAGKGDPIDDAAERDVEALRALSNGEAPPVLDMRPGDLTRQLRAVFRALDDARNQATALRGALGRTSR